MSAETGVYLITGFLGSGKTTLLNRIIKRFPKDKKLTLLVNEFGEVGVDGTLVEGEDIDVAERVDRAAEDVAELHRSYGRDQAGPGRRCPRHFVFRGAVHQFVGAGRDGEHRGGGGCHFTRRGGRDFLDVGDRPAGHGHRIRREPAGTAVQGQGQSR